jgi:hypothetical protein
MEKKQLIYHGHAALEFANDHDLAETIHRRHRAELTRRWALA